MSISRWATNCSMSRSRSASAPFSASSVSAIVLLVVIVGSLAKLKVSQPNLTKSHDDRLPRGLRPRRPYGYRLKPETGDQIRRSSYTTSRDVSKVDDLVALVRRHHYQRE